MNDSFGLPSQRERESARPERALAARLRALAGVGLEAALGR